MPPEWESLQLTARTTARRRVMQVPLQQQLVRDVAVLHADSIGLVTEWQQNSAF